MVFHQLKNLTEPFGKNDTIPLKILPISQLINKCPLLADHPILMDNY